MNYRGALPLKSLIIINQPHYCTEPVNQQGSMACLTTAMVAPPVPWVASPLVHPLCKQTPLPSLSVHYSNSEVSPTRTIRPSFNSINSKTTNVTGVLAAPAVLLLDPGLIRDALHKINLSLFSISKSSRALGCLHCKTLISIYKVCVPCDSEPNIFYLDFLRKVNSDFPYSKRRGHSQHH